MNGLCSKHLSLSATDEFRTRNDFWSHPRQRVRVSLAALIDKNGDGVIDYQEFLPVCFSMIVEILSDKVCVVFADSMLIISKPVWTVPVGVYMYKALLLPVGNAFTKIIYVVSRCDAWFRAPPTRSSITAYNS